MTQIPLRRIPQFLILFAVFFALTAFPTENLSRFATISLQDGSEISGRLTGSRLRFRTSTDSLPIAMDLSIAGEKIARYADNRLELTSIAHVDGSFVGGEFIIATSGGEVRHSAANVVSIRLRGDTIDGEGAQSTGTSGAGQSDSKTLTALVDNDTLFSNGVGASGTPAHSTSAICETDPSATCFFAEAVRIAAASGNTKRAIQTYIQVASLSLRAGNDHYVEIVRPHVTAYFSSGHEPDFRVVVDYGALLAATGDVQGALNIARSHGAHQVANAISQISGKLSRFFDQHDVALQLADYVSDPIFKNSVFEKAAVRHGELGDIAAARTMISRMSRSSNKASTLAQLASQKFRAGDRAAGDQLLQEALIEASRVIRPGSEKTDIARAHVLAGDINQAFSLLNSANDNWKRYIAGHTAAGAAEIGEIDIAKDLATRLTIFREMGSKVALDEIIAALIRTERMGEFKSFANSLQDNGRIVAFSTLAREYASLGQFAEARNLFSRIEDPWERMAATISIAVAYVKAGDLSSALGLFEGLSNPDHRTRFLVAVGGVLLEEIAVEGSTPPRPDFTRTETSKDSWVLSRYWRDNAPVYDRVRLATAGEGVIVWGEPNSQGDCLVDSHEGTFMKCADLAAFASPPSADTGSIGGGGGSSWGARVADMCSGLPLSCREALNKTAKAWWDEALAQMYANQTARRSFEMLFSNPGAIASDTERLQLFEQMLEDEAFVGELHGRLNSEFLSRSDIGLPKLDKTALKNIASYLAISIITDLAVEYAAADAEQRGDPDLSYWIRTAGKPTIEIIGLAKRPTVGTTTAAGVPINAGFILAKNIYSFTALGMHLNADQAAGRDVQSELDSLAKQNASIVESLITGETQGVLYEGHPVRKLTQKEIDILQDQVAINNNYQTELLKRQAIHAEFSWVTEFAKKFAAVVAEVDSVLAESAKRVSGPANMTLGGFHFAQLDKRDVQENTAEQGKPIPHQAGSATTPAAQQSVAKSALLAYAPADTPYIFTNSRPLPAALVEKFLLRSEVDFKQAQQDLQQLIETAEFDTPEEKHMVVLMQAILAELQGNMSSEGLASLGLRIDGKSLIYGLGVLPVVRSEIADRQKVLDLIARVEQRSGMSSPQQQLGEQSYRRFDMEQLVGIMAVTDQYFIAAVLPAKAEQELLPLVLGEKMPEQSMADNAAFGKLMKDNGYLGYGEGYVDLVKFTEIALGESQGINAMIFSALDGAPTEMSAACTAMVMSLAHSVPRINGGFTAATDNSYSIQAMIETSADIVGRLQRMAAPIPGLGVAGEAMLSIGIGLNLAEVRDALKAGMQSVLQQGKDCELVDQQEITQAMLGVDIIFNPLVTDLKGFDLQINDIVFDQQNLTPRTVDAQLLLAAEDPRSVFGMLGMLNHKFTQLQIPDDGTPVVLPLEKLSPDAPLTHIAFKGKALVLSTGGDPRSKSAAAFAASLALPAPMFALNHNGAKLLERLLTVDEQILQNLAGDEDMLSGYKGFKNSSERYGNFSMRVIGTADGLVINQQVMLR